MRVVVGALVLVVLLLSALLLIQRKQNSTSSSTNKRWKFGVSAFDAVARCDDLELISRKGLAYDLCMQQAQAAYDAAKRSAESSGDWDKLTLLTNYLYAVKNFRSMWENANIRFDAAAKQNLDEGHRQLMAARAEAQHVFQGY